MPGTLPGPETDARAQHPDERIYTFRDYFRQHWPRNAGLRIDRLLLSADLAPYGDKRGFLPQAAHIRRNAFGN